jgi:hypothetical protein
MSHANQSEHVLTQIAAQRPALALVPTFSLDGIDVRNIRVVGLSLPPARGGTPISLANRPVTAAEA